jgi:hypothetical protein
LSWESEHEVEKIAKTPDNCANNSNPRRKDVYGISRLLIFNHSRRNWLVYALVMVRVMRTQSCIRHLDARENIPLDKFGPVEEKDPYTRDHLAETLKPREIMNANTHEDADSAKNRGTPQP